ncbi:MAG: radical SAM protein [bacterium]
MILVVPPNHTSRFAFPQQGIVSLASALKRKKLKVSVTDCQLHRDFLKPLLKAVAEDDDIGFYTTTYSYPFVKGAAAAIKKFNPRARIILGGPHASHLPEKLVEDFADIVVAGEGEKILPRILAGEALEYVPSVSYKNGNGEVMENPRAGLLEDLDSLPFPAWELLDYKKFSFSHYRRLPLVSMVTSRGCEFRCIYCASSAVHGHETRMRGIESVVGEIELDVEKYGVRELHIVDDDFTCDVERVKEICRAIISRGLNKKILLAKPNAIRPDRGDREMFDLMKMAGFYFTAIAVESADPEVAKKLGRNTDSGRHYETIAMARKAGLFINTFFLMGSPFDTRETMMKNIKLACSIPTDIVSFFMMKPYPGTPLFSHLVKTGKIEDRNHCGIPSCNDGKSFYSANDWNEEDLIRLVMFGYKKYYLNPYRFVRLLLRLPLFISNPIILMKLFFNLLFGGSPASDSRRQRRDIDLRVSSLILQPEPPRRLSTEE